MFQIPIVVMGGSAYTDIDVLACAAAYKQYLQLQGYKAFALVQGPWNQTIPNIVKEWPIDVEDAHWKIDLQSQFVLVDFSDPSYVNVDLGSVIEVFDHHHGYEDYWKNKIGSQAYIEKVGACATLIWERFKAAKVEDQISPINANLLYTAIFANTLDFRSSVTTQRDINAAKELLAYTQLPMDDFKVQYYAQIESQFLQNAEKSLLEDTKKILLNGVEYHFGQIELAHAKNFLDRHSMFGLQGKWIVNIVSIQEGCSYIFCNCEKVTKDLKRITASQMNELKLLIAPRLWMRKELLKELIYN
jgi:inorganic pyrophosphatase/exopolyphosphatase